VEPSPCFVLVEAQEGVCPSLNQLGPGSLCAYSNDEDGRCDAMGKCEKCPKITGCLTYGDECKCLQCSDEYTFACASYEDGREECICCPEDKCGMSNITAYYHYYYGLSCCNGKLFDSYGNLECCVSGNTIYDDGSGGKICCAPSSTGGPFLGVSPGGACWYEGEETYSGGPCYPS